MATQEDVKRFMECLYAPSDITAIVYSHEAFRLALEDFERRCQSRIALETIHKLLSSSRELGDNSISHAANMAEQIAEKVLNVSKSV